jgi:hypothetical protein
MNRQQVNAKEKCAHCDKKFHIRKLFICKKCGKILCETCKNYLSKKTAEINFQYHYACFDVNDKKDVPGEFVKIYNL